MSAAIGKAIQSCDSQKVVAVEIYDGSAVAPRATGQYVGAFSFHAVVSGKWVFLQENKHGWFITGGEC